MVAKASMLSIPPWHDRWISMPVGAGLASLEAGNLITVPAGGRHDIMVWGATKIGPVESGPNTLPTKAYHVPVPIIGCGRTERCTSRIEISTVSHGGVSPRAWS